MFLMAIFPDFQADFANFCLFQFYLMIGHSKVSLQQERCCLCNVDMSQQCLAQAHFIISTVGRHRWVLTCEPVQQRAGRIAFTETCRFVSGVQVSVGVEIFLLIKWLLFTIYRQNVCARSQGPELSTAVSHQLPAGITGMLSRVSTGTGAPALLTIGRF